MWMSLYDASLKGVKYYDTMCGYHGNRHFGFEEATIAEECGKRRGAERQACVCECECVKSLSV